MNEKNTQEMNGSQLKIARLERALREISANSSCLDSQDIACKALDDNSENRIWDAVNIAKKYKENDGSHHKDWVIDQMVRALTGCEFKINSHGFRVYGESKEYNQIVQEACNGSDGPNTYEWYVGIAP